MILFYRIASDFADHSEAALAGDKNLLANPINAYLYMKRFTLDWDKEVAPNFQSDPESGNHIEKMVYTNFEERQYLYMYNYVILQQLMHFHWFLCWFSYFEKKFMGFWFYSLATLRISKIKLFVTLIFLSSRKDQISVTKITLK